MIPSNLTDQLVRDEAEVLHAYPDEFGYLTIGVGRLIDPRKGGGISQGESRMLLQHDIEKVAAQLKTHLPWSTNLVQERWAVLANMAFNMGIEHLLEFHEMLKFAQAGDYTAAAAAGRDSLWFRQVGARAERLMTQLELGQWQ